MSAIVRFCAHGLCLLPLVYMVYQGFNDGLGVDPAETIAHLTGSWALRFLLLCLVMTPLRYVVASGWPVQYRRMLGLYAYFYASLHLVIFLVAYLQFDLGLLLEELRQRPYIMIGFAALLMLMPLAATSNRVARRRLGKRWIQLHRLVYPASILAFLHFFWLVKSDYSEPILYGAILILLFIMRASKIKALIINRSWRA